MNVALSFNNNILSYNGNWLEIPSVDPYNPLGLPPYTIRLQFTSGVTPTFARGSATQVSSSPNVWDLTYSDYDWSIILGEQYNLEQVLGANTTGVTNMANMFYDDTSLTSVALFDTSAVTGHGAYSMFCRCSALTSVPLFDLSSVTSMAEMFEGCTSLTTVPLFDTSSVTNMNQAFSRCTSLTTVPLFDTSSVTNFSSMFNGCSALTAVPLLNTSSAGNVSNMFYYCHNVQSGALALYQQMSTQSTPPVSHANCFVYCGDRTTTGAAELAQIPTSWGGTMS